MYKVIAKNKTRVILQCETTGNETLYVNGYAIACKTPTGGVILDAKCWHMDKVVDWHRSRFLDETTHQTYNKLNWRDYEVRDLNPWATLVIGVHPLDKYLNYHLNRKYEQN